MKSLNLLYRILILVLITNSCKKDKQSISNFDEDFVFQTYSLVYDKTTNQTTVTALFQKSTISGEYLNLSEFNTLSMNGMPMQHDYPFYTCTINGILNSAVITFKTTEGKEYINTLSALSPLTNSNSNYVDNELNSNWYWIGNPIEENEKVTLYLFSLVNSGTSVHFEDTIVGSSTYIPLTDSLLSILPDGSANAKIYRSKSSTNGNFTTSGGRLYTSYCALDTLIEIH